MTSNADTRHLLAEMYRAALEEFDTPFPTEVTTLARYAGVDEATIEAAQDLSDVETVYLVRESPDAPKSEGVPVHSAADAEYLSREGHHVTAETRRRV